MTFSPSTPITGSQMLLPPRWERFFFGHHKPATSSRFSVRRLRSIEVMIQRKLMVRVHRTAQEQLYNQIISMYNVSTCAFGCRQIHRHAGFYRIDIRLTLIPRQGPPRRLRGITGGTAHASAQYCTYTSTSFQMHAMRQRNRIRGSLNPVEQTDPVECAQRPICEDY